MKKIWGFVSLFCLCLLSGIFLTACGSNIELVISQDNTSLYEYKVNINGVEKDFSSDTKVSEGDNITINVYAKRAGVDMSDFKATVNGVERQVFVSSKYNLYTKDNDEDARRYGYIKIPQINEATEVSFSGAKMFNPTMTFKINNATDSAIAEKMGKAQINMDGTFKPMSEVFTINQTTHIAEASTTRSFDLDSVNNMFDFKLKFDGVNPYYSLDQSAYYVLLDDNTQRVAKAVKEVQGQYYIEFGQLPQQKNYIVMINFAGMYARRYSFNLPAQNLVYSVKVDSSKDVAYDEEKEFTVTIADDYADKVDTSEMKLFANNKELTLVEDKTSGNVYTYKLPKYSTPSDESTFRTVYEIQVKGLKEKEGYKLRRIQVAVDEGDKFNQVYTSCSFGKVDDLGDITDVTMYQDSNAYVFNGERIGIEWKYRYDQDSKAYETPFKMNKYVLKYNDADLVDFEQLFKDKTESFTEELSSGHKIVATYDKDAQVFWKVRIEFVASEDMKFVLTGFEKFEKEYKFGVNTTDSLVTSVQFRYLKADGNWSDYEVLSAEKTYSLSYLSNFEYRVGFPANSVIDHDYYGISTQNRKFASCSAINNTTVDETQYITFTYTVQALQTNAEVDLSFTRNATKM